MQALETSMKNYEIAGSLLNERYKNQRVIELKYFKALFEQNTYTLELALAVGQLLDKIKTRA